MKYLNLLLLFLLLSCSSQKDAKTAYYQDVKGRNDITIYRIKVPQNWKRIDPETPPIDTKIAICEFFIEDPEGSIRITLHNFPSQTIDNRIPPGSQIARWKRQLPMVHENITPQSFSGYVGFLYEGDDGEKAMMGWIMQLGPEQYSRLSPTELKSDVTIKALGPLPLIQKHRQKIVNFARSFELISEIPLAS